jgi:hypothetical protein
MRIIIAVVFAAVLTLSASAQEFMADAGAPAVAFPSADRTVADIVSPIWHSEKERDSAGEVRQVVRLLGIKSGMTVADIGRGERLLCRTAVPDRWPPWPRYRRRCCARIFTGTA